MTQTWNAGRGNAWVDAQPILDGVLRPFEDLLVDAVRSAGARRVLDVGCGTGATTLAIARLLAGRGSCTGVDISEAMLARARERAASEAAPPDFITADAQHHAFAPATCDMIVSRFGVMFFDDPAAAFANLRRACKPGARLCAVAFRSPDENAFMTTAFRAAKPLLPDLPAPDPDAPGQFAFADRAKVEGILAQAGWKHIELRPIDVSCTLAEEHLMLYTARLGTVGQVLPQLDDHTRAQVITAVRAAFDQFVEGGRARFTAACWRIEASA